MKYAAQISFYIEAETDEEAKEILMDYISNGIKTDAAIELARPLKENKSENVVSFDELLSSLNIDDTEKH